MIDGIHPKAPVDHFFTEFSEALPFLEQESWIALDLETSGLSPWNDYISVVGLYGPKTKTACILHVRGVLDDHLIAWLSSSWRQFITHNGSTFDIPFLANAGVDITGPNWWDTMIGEQIVIATDRRGVSKNLQSSIKRRLNIAIEKNVDHKTWLQDHLDAQQLKYVAEDISFLPALRDAQIQMAKDTDAKWGLVPYYETGVESALHFEHRLMPIVVGMELRGLPIDESALSLYHLEQSDAASRAKHRIFEMTGWDGKLGYHKTIKKLALENFGVTLESTREDYLEEIKDLSIGSPFYEFVTTLLTYRKAAKRSGMYSETFLTKFVTDGWLRGRFRQMGTNTGRFSSSEPNMQQIPKGIGGARHIIGGLEGHKIVSVDYSQIEVRVAADISGDAALIGMLDATDIHTAIASQVFGVPPEAVTKEQRQLSKAMSFTLLFGGGAPLLSSYAKSVGVDMPISKARPIVIDFFDNFQGLKRMRMQAYAVQKAQRPFTIRLPTGIRRVLTPGEDLRATLILNNIVQGTAAAGLKEALLEADRRGLSKYFGAVVHDEIVSAVPEAEASDFAAELSEAMIVGMSKYCSDAPVAVEATIGDTWG